MSPAGGWSQLLAAISNGADAVYLGLTSYSARARAENFDPDPGLLDGLLGDDGTFDVDSYRPPEGRPAPLAAATRLAHRHRVRVYVAFNTLVFDGELREVQGLVEQMWYCGADAVIVQDVGVARIVEEVVGRLSAREKRETGREGRGLDGRPLEIHASTQQTVTCADGVSYAAERTNSTRVVLGRELSMAEIASISTGTDVEVEAFVHGALCVSYSGQCFSSEAWGGRSANRGQCAQACRLPYGLVADGELRHLTFDGVEGILGPKSGGAKGAEDGQDGYLLSPQDLCGLDHVESLARAGVSCLKIEGRLKDASYVAATTRSYRRAIDEAWDRIVSENPGRLERAPRRVLSSPDEGVSRRDLQHVFARGQDEDHDGLTPGFFEGPRHQRLVRGRSPRHRGLHVGRVVGSDGGALRIKLDGQALDLFEDDGVPPLKRGDGIVVDRGMAQDEELGGPLYDVKFDGSTAVVRFGRDVEGRWRRSDGRGSGAPMAPRDAHVWKTSDSEIGGRMGRLATLDPPRWPADVVVGGDVGSELTVRIKDLRSGVEGSAISDGMLEKATGSGLSEKSLRKAVGTLGNTRWSLEGFDISSLDPEAWAPMGRVKDARRRAVDDLERRMMVSEEGPETHAKASNYASSDLHDTDDEEEPVIDELLNAISDGGRVQPIDTRGEGPRVSVLCRTYDQVDAICRMMEEDRSRHDSDDEWSSSRARHQIDELIVDFLEVDSLERAVDRIRGSGKGANVTLASPRVIKPGEEGIWKTLLRLGPDGLLVRSTGLLHRLTNLGGTGASVDLSGGGDAQQSAVVTIPELVGDFSLNAANALTAHEYLASGLSRITASYDLSAAAITELANNLGGGSSGSQSSSTPSLASRLEVVVHCHMPIFHTEHCVFARFLSGGDSYQDCGHVCTRKTVHLRDQEGRDNLVLADMGCRNTVFQVRSEWEVGGFCVRCLTYIFGGTGREPVRGVQHGRVGRRWCRIVPDRARGREGRRRGRRGLLVPRVPRGGETGLGRVASSGRGPGQQRPGGRGRRGLPEERVREEIWLAVI